MEKRDYPSSKKNYHKPCEVAGCGRSSWKKVSSSLDGAYYCKHHYRVLVLGERPKEYRPKGSQKNKKCKIAGCLNLKRSRDLCNSHYHKQRKGLDVSAPINRRRMGYKGLGYVSVKPETLQYYQDIAEKRGVKVDDVATEILEAYFKLKQAEQIVEPRINRDPWYQKQSVFDSEVEPSV
jgi:hypothetical protein